MPAVRSAASRRRSPVAPRSSTASISATATPLVRAFGRDFAAAGGLLAPDFLQSGLALGEVRCLYELGQADGLEISELARLLDLDLGYVSRVVSRLASRGLASKRAADRDPRARAATITAKGRARLAVLDRHTNRRLASWLAGKPADAVAKLAAGLRALYGDAEPVVVRGPRPGTMGTIIARHAEIYTAEFGYGPAFGRYVMQACLEFMQGFAPPRDRIFIAERGGEFLGSIAIKGLPEATSQLRFLLLERHARGLGLGRKLVRRVIDHARAMGDRRMLLETASDLIAARALYAAHGFRLVNSFTESFHLPGVQREQWELDLAAGDRRTRGNPVGRRSGVR